MTHDELLAKIDELPKAIYHEPFIKALRAVVELHKPDDNKFHIKGCMGCSWDKTYMDWQEHYPCATIQAIEKEL